MKKTLKNSMILLIAIAFILILAGSVNAASAPTVETINGREMFFANGTPITIEANGTGALIKWEGDQKEVSSVAYIFGGMHNNDTEVNSSIIMNGGTVRAVMGGGLHKCNTKTATVIINGGTINSVTGGGVGAHATMANNCPCGGYSAVPAELQLSETKTGTTNVTVNGGNISLLFGAGSSGYTRTDAANLKVTGGTVEAVTAGSSNGSTGSAKLEVTGGTLGLVQSIQRGKLGEANVKVSGGDIAELYVCSSYDTKTAAGEITGEVTVEVTGSAKVEKMELGQMGTEKITEPNNVVKKENVKVAEGTVEDSTAIDNNVTKLNTIKVDGKTYYVEAGKTIKDLAEYASITAKDGYRFLGFKTAQGEWKENEELTDGIELTTVFEKIEVGTVENAPEKDETPKMGSNIISVYVIVALVSLVAVVAVKKYNA